MSDFDVLDIVDHITSSQSGIASQVISKEPREWQLKVITRAISLDPIISCLGIVIGVCSFESELICSQP
jgi:hypothetical protein